MFALKRRATANDHVDTPSLTPFTDNPQPSDNDTATYAMIADVLAGKIMTALTYDRPGAARESATELFSLLENGTPATAINFQTLAFQIFDMIERGKTDMAAQGQIYLERLADYGINPAAINRFRLKARRDEIIAETSLPAAESQACAFYRAFIDLL